MKKTSRAFWVMVVLALLGWPTLVMADAASQAFVAAGRAKMFNGGNPTYSGILDAKADFEAAVDADNSDAGAHFFLAICTAAEFSLQNGNGSGLETAMDLANAFGIERNDNDNLEDGLINPPPALYEHYDPPSTVPTGGELRVFLDSQFIPFIDGLIAHLSVPGTGFVITLTAGETGDAPVEIDYGDVLVIRSLLHHLKSVVHIVIAYEMDVDLHDIIAKGTAGVFKFQRFIEENEEALKLRPTDGSVHLGEARASLLAGIDDYRDGLNFITGERDSQSDHLLFFSTTEEEQSARYALELMTELKTSLEENRAYARENTYEQWLLTNGQNENLVVEYVQSQEGNFSYSHVMGFGVCSFFACDGNVTAVSRNGDQITWSLINEGFCPATATLTGTVSGGNVSGTYTVSDCTGVDRNGTFSGVNTDTSPHSENYNFNRVFGNTGEPPLDIRSVLPKFSNHNEMIAGTFPGTPVLNGIVTHLQTNRDIAMEMTLAYETRLDGSGSENFVIPTFADGTIVIDGSSSDWPVGAMAFEDFIGDEAEGLDFEGSDVSEVYLAKDSSNLYAMFKLGDGPPLTTEGMCYIVELANSSQPGNANQYGNILLGVQFSGGQWIPFIVQRDWSVGLASIYAGTPSDAGAGADFIEWRLPLTASAEVPSPWGGTYWVNWEYAYASGRYLVAYTLNTGGMPPVRPASDYNHTLIRLNTTTISGAVTCSASDAGCGPIYLYAMPCSNPKWCKGMAYDFTSLNAAGQYSFENLPIGAGVHVYALRDSDLNGFLSFGDATGISGQIIAASAGNIVNLDVDTPIDDTVLMTKPGVYRVFGSNDYVMPDPANYWGPWDPNQVDWTQGGVATWTYLGEASTTYDYPTSGKYYRYILIMYPDGTRFNFDAVTADAGVNGVSFGFKNLSPVPGPWGDPEPMIMPDDDFRMISGGIWRYDGTGWGGRYLSGAPDGVYSYNDGGDGFILLQMPAESYDGYDSGTQQGIFTTIPADGGATTLSVTIATEELLPPVFYDDFQMSGIDGAKWKDKEAGRWIDPGAGVLKMNTASDTGYSRVRLHMSNPETITSLAADMTVEDAAADTNGTFAFAQIQGIFYSTVDGNAGDVVASIMLRQIDGGLQPYWEIDRLFADGTWETYDGGIFSQTTPVIDSAYRAQIVYDGATGFALTFNNQTVNQNGPAYSGMPALNVKDLSVGVQSDNENGWGNIAAAFDNVWVGTGGGALAEYDPFTTGDFDQTRWAEGELGRWVDTGTGELVMSIGSPDGERSDNNLNASRITSYFGADVTVRSNEIVIQPGARGHARLQGYLYNDTYAPGSYNGMEGDIYAQVYFEARDRNQGGGQEYSLRCYIERSDNADHTAYTPLFFHAFPYWVTPDQNYRLSMRLTDNAVVFTAQNLAWGDDFQVVTYPITGNMYPPYTQQRRLRTRIEGKYTPGAGGTMTARFDNVMMGPAFQFNGVTKYVHFLEGGVDTHEMWYEIDIPPGGYSGKLPDDIAKVEVTVPGGQTIDLDLSACNAETYGDGGFYMGCQLPAPALPAAGDYVFTVTTVDDLSVSFTVTRGDAVPIDIANFANMFPADGTFQNQNHFFVPQVAVPQGLADLYYRLEVFNLDGTGVYRAGRIAYPADGKFHVPAGKLVPGMKYKWRMRVVDSSDNSLIQNRSHTPMLAFTAFGGDVDASGTVDINDAVKALKAMAGADTSGFDMDYGDINGDGTIGCEDALFILQAISGIR